MTKSYLLQSRSMMRPCASSWAKRGVPGKGVRMVACSASARASCRNARVLSKISGVSWSAPKIVNRFYAPRIVRSNVGAFIPAGETLLANRFQPEEKPTAPAGRRQLHELRVRSDIHTHLAEPPFPRGERGRRGTVRGCNQTIRLTCCDQGPGELFLFLETSFNVKRLMLNVFDTRY